MLTSMKPCRSLSKRLAQAVVALVLCAAGAANAQLRLPSLNLPQPLGQPGLDTLVRPAERLLDRAEPDELGALRLVQVAELLRRHPDVLEVDPRGEPVVRSEILATSPTPAVLRAAAGLGFQLIREQQFDDLGASLIVLRAPAGMKTAEALARLRSLDPQASFDFNHVYMSGASVPLDGGATGSAPTGGVRAPGAVGLIDSGVATGHPVFAEATIEEFGCGGTRHPAPHGTAVAALMVGRAERFRGAASGTRLYAADIYCDSPTGGSADKIAAALGWMSKHGVGVINLSLVGPANATLGRMVAAMVARGHLLVAAVGNDGPAAPPLYPASYPGVVGVSGVDRQGRPLPEAARGPQVMFAAPGSQMVSAAPGAPPYRQVRGTSFAAPIVAALLAQSLPQPDREASARALAALRRQAVRSDPASISNATGYGVVGASLRVDPARFR
ncbi:S8 family serine peptidase [Massilia niastensis]|uniref:S8 family serine peptidase n=1 Tax=Massilia niastensis TaxID=544911 RepID=UPI00039D4B5B|nr:S8 family serine peptidase [Massilia niastensis]